MTALAADRNTPARAGDVVVLPVRSSAATTIYAGSLVCLDPEVGKVLPAGVAGSADALPVFVGVAEETVINPLGGAKTVRIRRRGVFRFAASDWESPVKMVGQLAFAIDDQAVGDVDWGESRSPVGRVVDGDTDGAWIEIGDFASLPCGAVDFLSGTLAGTADGTMVDIAAAAGACAGGSSPSAGNVDTAIATAVAPIVSGVNEQLKELQTTLNSLLSGMRSAGQMLPSD